MTGVQWKRIGGGGEVSSGPHGWGSRCWRRGVAGGWGRRLRLRPGEQNREAWEGWGPIVVGVEPSF